MVDNFWRISLHSYPYDATNHSINLAFIQPEVRSYFTYTRRFRRHSYIAISIHRNGDLFSVTKKVPQELSVTEDKIQTLCLFLGRYPFIIDPTGHNVRIKNTK